MIKNKLLDTLKELPRISGDSSIYCEVDACDLDLLIKIIEEVPCTCHNPDGSYPHDETNPLCYKNETERLLKREH